MSRQQSTKYYHDKLHRWYLANGRKFLPWRNTDDPYAIWVSEIMLQQTQVKTVLERYYQSFLERFPTIFELAKAPQDTVLKQWEGLGYYSRARNLQKAAIIVAKVGGVPKDVDGLMALPGIGKNTAHAIAAFAYHQSVPILEANVKRVVARLFALEEALEASLWEYAWKLLDHDEPYNYNQAMMDIGAMVCTKKNPNCGQCPLQVICKGRQEPSRYAPKKHKTKVATRHKVIVVHKDAAGKLWMVPRKTQFLHGLYHFDEYAAQEVPKLFLSSTVTLGEVTQKYSHFTLQAKVVLSQIEGVFPKLGGSWYGVDEIAGLPLSEADRKVLTLL